jgi:thiol-disulfide isomerase/thioredoxin
MKKALSNRTKTLLLGLVFVLILSFASFAQKKTPDVKPTPDASLPKVTQIDEAGLKTALKPNGKPLLVNFWATWCDPCREEFPDLVKLDAEYKGKIDFITVSIDDLAEIRRDVPKFLVSMKAGMPAYLLKVADESAVISSITKDWNGGLPFTILYNEKGEIAYFKQGKVKIDALKVEIDKLTTKPAATTSSNNDPFQLENIPEEYEKGKTDAQKDIANGVLKIQRSGRGFFFEQTQILREKYGILTANSGGFITSEIVSYNKGYNEISRAEIRKRFGEDFFQKVETEAKALRPIANVDELTLTINRKQ